MKKIRIAQIGTSIYSHGSQIWNVLTKMTDVFEIVGYAFPEEEREKFPDHMKFFDGYREMTVEEILSDHTVEAVFVETEEIYLTKYALMVAKAGKHLHMEKPGGTDPSDFKELISVLKEKNLIFSTGYMFRFNPKIREAIEKARRGDLGRIFSVEAQMGCLHDKVWRRWLDAFPDGMMFFLGCHLVDIVYRILGEPKEVIPLSASTGKDGIDAVDYGMAVFRYENGVSFVKTTDVEVAGNMRRQVVITGERGTIEIRPLEEDVPRGKQYAVSRESLLTDDGVRTFTERSEDFTRYGGMLMNFAEMVRGKENPYSCDYELKLYELILKACGANK